MAEPQLVVVGSTNVDLIMRLPHLPARAETVADGQFSQVFGGKGANTAVGARRAGGNVTFVTGLGDDTFGTQARAALEAEGIDLSCALVAAGTATGTAIILLDEAGNNSIAVAPGANYALRPEHIGAAEPAFREAAAILLQMEIPVDTIRATLEIAARDETPVLFNFAPVRTRELPIDGHMTTLVVNEVEAATLAEHPVTDPNEAMDAALLLLGYGPEVVVVTLGGSGVVVVSNEGRCHVPAFPVEVVDTTAAGDIFCGAFAVACAEGKDPEAAARFASAASAIAVTRLGAQPSAPRREEIEAFLAARS
ncbi:MAG: ribokinase [Fimbriimonas sp.]